MTVGSLFSGVGLMDLGLEWAGFECKWQVEKDDYARQVLTRHWPDVPQYRDVRFFLGSKRWRRARGAWEVDLLCGGFPCQPVSLAGRRRGQEDERWLWPEFARVIRLLRPRFVLVENVPGLLVRGMGDVLGDLSALGYDAEWDSLPASAFGAPHLRWRVFLVAYTSSPGWPGRIGWRQQQSQGSIEARDVAHAPDGGQWHGTDQQERKCGGSGSANACVGREAMADTESLGGELRSSANGRPWRSAGGSSSRADGVGTRLEIFPRERGNPLAQFTASERGRQWREWWEVEPGLGRVVDGCPHRVDRLKGLGNGVVPACAEYIGRRILALAQVLQES